LRGGNVIRRLGRLWLKAKWPPEPRQRRHARPWRPPRGSACRRDQYAAYRQLAHVRQLHHERGGMVRVLVMHLVRAVTFVGVTALVFVSLIAVERIIGG